MSVVTAVRKNGKAAIASDSLCAADPIILPAQYRVNHQKIFSFDNSYIGVVGEAVMKATLTSVLNRNRSRIDFSSSETIFESMRKLHNVLKKQYHIAAHEFGDGAVELSHVHALIVNPNGVFEINGDRDVTEWTRFCAMGCGSQLALGAMHALYERCDDVTLIASAGVEAAAEFSAGCGLPLECQTVMLKRRNGTSVCA